LKAYTLFSPEEAADIASALKYRGWAPGQASKAKAVTKHNEEFRDDALCGKVLDRVRASPIPKAHFVSEFSPPKFNRYRDGGEYAVHIDAAAIRQVRTDLAATVFLTDDYEGGELEIDGQSIRLPAGHALVYDCWRPHRVRPVTSGERIACIFWMQSHIRSDEQRDLLNMLHSVIADETNEEKFAKLGCVHAKLTKMWWS